MLFPHGSRKLQYWCHSSVTWWWLDPLFLCCSSFIYGHFRGHSLANWFTGTEAEGWGSKRAGAEGCLLSRYTDMTIETVRGKNLVLLPSHLLWRPKDLLERFNMTQPHTTPTQLNGCSMQLYVLRVTAHFRIKERMDIQSLHGRSLTFVSKRMHMHFQITRIHTCTPTYVELLIHIWYM